MPNYGILLAFIGSGPNGGDLEWTRRFFTGLTARDRNMVNRLYGWALHYYCGTTGKGQAIDFTVDDWYALLSKATVMENLITDHWAAMAEVDRRHRVKLVVDEWAHGTTPARRSPAHIFSVKPRRCAMRWLRR